MLQRGLRQGLERRLVCQRLAAEQLLYSGHLDEGLRTIEDVLATVNLKLAKTARRALMSLLWRRLRLRMRGFRYKSRAIGEISPATIQLIDTSYAVGTSLSLVDAVRASAFQTLNLRLSLDAGDPYRIARSLAMEAGFVSSMGVKQVPRVKWLLAEANRLAQQIENPHAAAMVLLLSGVSSYEMGQLPQARDDCRAAEELLRTQCSGVAWELACARLFGSWSQYRLGDIGPLVERIPVLEREAAERGDLYGRLVMALGCPRVAMTLATDRPLDQRKVAEDAIALWPGDYYQIQHYWADYALLHIDLYANEPEVAWQRCERAWPLLKRALLLRVEEVIVYMTEIRARIALALAARTRENRAYIDVVQRAAKFLAARRVPWCGAMASLLRAQLASISRDRHEERELLAQAHKGLEESQLLPYEMVTRLRHSALVGGKVRDEQAAVVSQWAQAHGIVSIAGLTRMLAPAFGDGVRTLTP